MNSINEDPFKILDNLYDQKRELEKEEKETKSKIEEKKDKNPPLIKEVTIKTIKEEKTKSTSTTNSTNQQLNINPVLSWSSKKKSSNTGIQIPSGSKNKITDFLSLNNNKNKNPVKIKEIQKPDDGRKRKQSLDVKGIEKSSQENQKEKDIKGNNTLKAIPMGKISKRAASIAPKRSGDDTLALFLGPKNKVESFKKLNKIKSEIKAQKEILVEEIKYFINYKNKLRGFIQEGKEMFFDNIDLLKYITNLENALDIKEKDFSKEECENLIKNYEGKRDQGEKIDQKDNPKNLIPLPSKKADKSNSQNEDVKNYIINSFKKSKQFLSDFFFKYSQNGKREEFDQFFFLLLKINQDDIKEEKEIISLFKLFFGGMNEEHVFGGRSLSTCQLFCDIVLNVISNKYKFGIKEPQNNKDYYFYTYSNKKEKIRFFPKEKHFAKDEKDFYCIGFLGQTANHFVLYYEKEVSKDSNCDKNNITGTTRISSDCYFFSLFLFLDILVSHKIYPKEISGFNNFIKKIQEVLLEVYKKNNLFLKEQKIIENQMKKDYINLAEISEDCDLLEDTNEHCGEEKNLIGYSLKDNIEGFNLHNLMKPDFFAAKTPQYDSVNPSESVPRSDFSGFNRSCHYFI